MKKRTAILLGAFLALVLVVSFFVDLRNTAKGGSIDLRNRVTGARVFLNKADPYHYKWTISEPPEYCDPYNQLAEPVSKVTATPSLLFLHIPLAKLSYALDQFLWLFIQWGFLLATLWLVKYMSCESGRFWLFAFFIAGFTYTAAWRLHAERGQVYVLYLFLLVCWLVMTMRKMEKGDWLAGFVVGALATLRPPFLLILPFLALHRRKQVIGMIAGVVVMGSLSSMVNPEGWANYLSGMQKNSEIYFSAEKPKYQSQDYPGIVEGIPIDKLAGISSVPYADSSFYALLKVMGWRIPYFLCAGFVLTLFGIWLWCMRKKNISELLPPLVAWLFLVDFFLPAYRNNYNDVLICSVFAASISSGFSSIKREVAWCILPFVLGWCIWGLEMKWKGWLIDLPTSLYFIFAAFIIYSSTRRSCLKCHAC